MEYLTSQYIILFDFVHIHLQGVVFDSHAPMHVLLYSCLCCVDTRVFLCIVCMDIALVKSVA